MGGGKDRDDHEQSSSIQDPRLVPRETQEDPCPQGSSSLLGSPRARTTHEDDRTTWPHCWCLQEEGRLIFNTHSTTTNLLWGEGDSLLRCYRHRTRTRSFSLWFFRLCSMVFLSFLRLTSYFFSAASRAPPCNNINILLKRNS